MTSQSIETIRTQADAFVPRLDLNIAILLPTYNDAATIAKVIFDFRRALPGHRIFVYDNNSTDDTAQQAALAGAIVVSPLRHGKGKDKGNVIRQMFTDIEADIYIMAGGSGTYDAASAPKLISALIDNRADMVIGSDLKTNTNKDSETGTIVEPEFKSSRVQSSIGKILFGRVHRTLFKTDLTDIFSGYRVFTRRFVKSFPAQSPGFNIETEMTVHAAILRLRVIEVACDNLEDRNGTDGTESDQNKLGQKHRGRKHRGQKRGDQKNSTLGRAFKIIRMMTLLLKETRPFMFFSGIALALSMLSIFVMTPVILEYFDTGQINGLPSWILALTLLLSAIMMFTAGVILDSLARFRLEQKRIHYQSIKSARGERYDFEFTEQMNRRDPDGAWTGTQLQRAR